MSTVLSALSVSLHVELSVPAPSLQAAHGNLPHLFPICTCVHILTRDAYTVSAGDSRAVLSRGDVAIPLTDDHKAAREDETVSIVQTCCFHVFESQCMMFGVLVLMSVKALQQKLAL